MTIYIRKSYTAKTLQFIVLLDVIYKLKILTESLSATKCKETMNNM